MSDARAPDDLLRPWARYAAGVLDAKISGRPPPDAPKSAARAGLFITLRVRRSGALRGCIGRIFPQRATLADDVADCAVLAATADPRFAPVQAPELAGLDVEISILTPPESVAGPQALDEKRYGVIVRSVALPARTGVLLPDIDGIESVAHQVQVATRKAKIGAGEAVTLERFEIQKAIVPLRSADAR